MNLHFEMDLVTPIKCDKCCYILFSRLLVKLNNVLLKTKDKRTLTCGWREYARKEGMADASNILLRCFCLVGITNLVKVSFCQV
jgi:hypothetical protein